MKPTTKDLERAQVVAGLMRDYYLAYPYRAVPWADLADKFIAPALVDERERAAKIVKSYVHPGESSRELWPFLRMIIRLIRAGDDA